MIPEFGLLCLIIAAVLAAAQTWMAGFSASTLSRQSNLPLLQRLCLSQLVFLSMSFIILSVLFYQNDFSVTYVANHSHVDLPWYYRLSAVWGAHEGSMLLWLLILGCWQTVVGISPGLHPQTRILMIGVMALISLCFCGFVLFTSNPFLRDFALINSVGQDLNPLLQDPGLIIHPPILYTGYVGTALAFALAVATLIRGHYQMSDFIWLRKWFLLSWAFLTAGITLGSWWAYRVLGWGGWWFWDPVENASFLPWLAGTALIHAMVMARKNGAFSLWTCFLCITVFSLSLLGTFLVRSGVLTSVHTFAADPSRGVAILALFGVLIGASALLFIWRLPQWPRTETDTLFSKQFFLLLNSAILFCFMLAVLSGTLYPLIIEVISGTALSVGAPYFSIIFQPFALLTLTLMSVVWLKLRCKKWGLYWLIPCTLGSCGITLAMSANSHHPVLLFVSLSLALWVFFVTLTAYYFHKTKRTESQSLSLATVLSHCGIFLLAMGIILSTSLSVQKDVRMGIGDNMTLGPYTFHLASMKGVREQNYQAMRLNFNIIENKSSTVIASTYAEKRLYHAQNTLLSHPGIVPGLWRDFYVAIGEAIPPKEWTIRLYYKPFVRWIWFSGVLIFLGALAGFVSVKPRVISQEQST